MNCIKSFLFILLLIGGLSACSSSNQLAVNDVDPTEEEVINSPAIIDLSHWKLTLPIGNPTEISPPEILDYANNQVVKPYMYNDDDRGGLAFFAEPNSSTANSKYSRSELREQLTPGSNSNNWTFAEGGRMVGKLAVDEISKDQDGKYHRVIVMQIHGRLTNEQRDLIGKDDNDAPPILKIYWQNGKIRVKSKRLKNLKASDEEVLHKDAWTDDDGHTFEEEVNFKKFKLEVIVSDGEMTIILNDNEYNVHKNDHLKRWGIFENYFKAGNYLQTTDEGAFAKVNYFSLEVSH